MGINYLARHSTFDPHPLDSHLSPFLSSDHSLLDFFRLRAVAVTVAYQKKPNSHSLNQLLKFFIFRTASVEKNHLQSLWTSRLPHLPCPLPPSRHRYRSPSAKGSTISDLIQREIFRQDVHMRLEGPPIEQGASENPGTRGSKLR